MASSKSSNPSDPPGLSGPRAGITKKAKESIGAGQAGEDKKKKKVAKPQQLMTRRWTEGAPKDENYYWDEPIPAHSDPFRVEDWPRPGMDLSSAWVGVVAMSQIWPAQRMYLWPLVFGSKYLNKSYLQKGRASKFEKRGVYFYHVFGGFELHGDEGRLGGLESELKEPVHGSRCLVQSLNYTPSSAPRSSAPSSSIFGPHDSSTTTPVKPYDPPATPPENPYNLPTTTPANPVDKTPAPFKRRMKDEDSKKQDPKKVKLEKEDASGSKDKGKGIGLHEYFTLPSSAFETLLPHLPHLTDLDVSHTRILGVITLSDDEEIEEENEDGVEELREKLRRAERKVVMLTSVLEKAHDAAELVSRWGQQSYQKMRTFPGLVDSAKTIKEGIKESTRTLNEAIEGLTERFPATAVRVASHGVGARAALNSWAAISTPEFGRLEDPGDLAYPKSMGF